MRPRRRAILRAGDLQVVFSRLLLAHVELLHRSPVLDPRHGGAGTEVVVRSVAPEADFRRHVAATMKVNLSAASAAKRPDGDTVFEGAFLILHEDEGVGLAAVLFDQDRPDHRHGMVGQHLDVLEFPDAVTLVENVDGFHDLFSRSLGALSKTPELSPASVIASGEQNRKAAGKIKSG
jgi:hypothetical protein